MTEPRADDPAALVAEARREHTPCGGPECPEPVCCGCAEDWPCLPARLADALSIAQDQLTAYRFGADTDADLNQHLGEMLRAARAEHRSCATFLEDAQIQLDLAIEDLERARADLAASRDAYRRAVEQEELWQDDAAALRPVVDAAVAWSRGDPDGDARLNEAVVAYAAAQDPPR